MSGVESQCEHRRAIDRNMMGNKKHQAPSLSAGVIVVRKHADGYRYLLLRAFRYWDFPKGLVEAGEDPLASAVREVAEETTLTDLKFRWGNCGE
jgi:bis(5'-nucleosidyl)-tetraphosphatase